MILPSERMLISVPLFSSFNPYKLQIRSSENGCISEVTPVDNEYVDWDTFIEIVP